VFCGFGRAWHLRRKVLRDQNPNLRGGVYETAPVTLEALTPAGLADFPLGARVRGVRRGAWRVLAECIESGPPGVETLGGVGLSGQGIGNDHGLKAIKKSLHFG